MYTDDGVGKERLLRPARRYTGDHWFDTSWDQALAPIDGGSPRRSSTATGRATRFGVSTTAVPEAASRTAWGTGKLMFSAIQTPIVRIHNGPADNSERQATREMGVGELKNSDQDAEVADVIMAIGCNSYETQTNYFLAHWVPNLQGGTVAKKQKWFPGEAGGEGPDDFVDPRRTPTIAVPRSSWRDTAA